MMPQKTENADIFFKQVWKYHEEGDNPTPQRARQNTHTVQNVSMNRKLSEENDGLSS